MQARRVINLREFVMAAGAGNRVMIEDIVLVGGLVGVQILNAGYSVLLSYLLELGLNSLTIVIFSNFATFFVVLPSSIYFERSKWPKNFNLKLFMQLLLMSFAGVTLYQIVSLKGVKLTSPAIATAMPNLDPGLIFIIAAAFRIENVKLSCTYTKLKIMGTLLCIMGNLTFSIMQSNSPLPKQQNGLYHDHNHNHNQDQQSLMNLIHFDANRIIGCMYLFASMVILSSSFVLQAIILVDFPAPISICAITSFLGAFMTLTFQLIQNHKLDLVIPQVISPVHLIGYCILGGTVGGISYSFKGWAMKKKGPVLVSMFTPISTVVSAILSFFTFGEVLTNFSLLGMVVMFLGLYIFLWAKNKEDSSTPQQPISHADSDVEKHLLS